MTGSVPAAIEVRSELDEAGGEVVLTLHPLSRIPGVGFRQWTLSLGGVALVTFSSHMERTVLARRPFAELRDVAHGGVSLRDSAGADLSDAVDLTLVGPLFEAAGLDTAEAFFARVQQHHSRFPSPFLLEVAARCAFARFPEDFSVRASALAIIGHRYLERVAGGLDANDLRRIGWMLERAAPVVAEGERLIQEDGTSDWQLVRWTVSLATVAGYLALIRGEYEEAERYFAVNVRHVRLVRLSRVSALNFVTGCFVHGLLAHLRMDRDAARESLTTGVRSVPDIVAAQDLLENVWVLGDLMNVLAVARQCFIALVRLRLLPKPAGGPVIEPGMQVSASAIAGPLSHILDAGFAPALREHIAANRG